MVSSHETPQPIITCTFCVFIKRSRQLISCFEIPLKSFEICLTCSARSFSSSTETTGFFYHFCSVLRGMLNALDTYLIFTIGSNGCLLMFTTFSFVKICAASLYFSFSCQRSESVSQNNSKNKKNKVL